MDRMTTPFDAMRPCARAIATEVMNDVTVFRKTPPVVTFSEEPDGLRTMFALGIHGHSHVSRILIPYSASASQIIGFCIDLKLALSASILEVHN